MHIDIPGCAACKNWYHAVIVHTVTWYKSTIMQHTVIHIKRLKNWILRNKIRCLTSSLPHPSTTAGTDSQLLFMCVLHIFHWDQFVCLCVVLCLLVVLVWLSVAVHVSDWLERLVSEVTGHMYLGKLIANHSLCLFGCWFFGGDIVTGAVHVLGQNDDLTAALNDL